MGDAGVWNEETRNDLRESLRRLILGEVRLSKRSYSDVLEICREAYIQEEAPESEWGDFTQFASDELGRTANSIAIEQLEWPNETDCDRLDRVEAALRERGILLWQVSPCCDTCTLGELSDRIRFVDERHPGFRKRIRGYAFFIDQNMPEALADDTSTYVCLGYGWISPNQAEVPQDEYETKAIGVGREVCECLRREGFETDWNNDISRKIVVSLNWRRRTMLD